MIYTSTSLALAVVETFVHFDPAFAPRDLVSMEATIPDNIPLERVDVAALPKDWKIVGREDLRQIGAAWISSNRCAALCVPSAAISGEWNVLLNPAHSEFSKVMIAAPQPFVFDPRMFK